MFHQETSSEMVRVLELAQTLFNINNETTEYQQEEDNQEQSLEIQHLNQPKSIEVKFNSLIS